MRVLLLIWFVTRGGLLALSYLALVLWPPSPPRSRGNLLLEGWSPEGTALGPTLANLALLASLALLYRVAERRHGPAAAERTALLVAVQPFSFFYSQAGPDAWLVLVGAGLLYAAATARPIPFALVGWGWSAVAILCLPGKGPLWGGRYLAQCTPLFVILAATLPDRFWPGLCYLCSLLLSLFTIYCHVAPRVYLWP